MARSQELKADPGGHGTYWDSDEAGRTAAPAPEFTHGFCKSGTAPITRTNDPFWNLRAFDNAVAQHRGYLLASFICGMNQVVMDDVAGLASSVSISSAKDPIKRCSN